MEEDVYYFLLLLMLKPSCFVLLAIQKTSHLSLLLLSLVTDCGAQGPRALALLPPCLAWVSPHMLGASFGSLLRALQRSLAAGQSLPTDS